MRPLLRRRTSTDPDRVQVRTVHRLLLDTATWAAVAADRRTFDVRLGVFAEGDLVELWEVAFGGPTGQVAVRRVGATTVVYRSPRGDVHVLSLLPACAADVRSAVESGPPQTADDDRPA